MIHTIAGALMIGAHLILGGSDCQVTHVYSDDGSASAACADGTHWYYDADGQTSPAAPYVAPGSWVNEADTN